MDYKSSVNNVTSPSNILLSLEIIILSHNKVYFAIKIFILIGTFEWCYKSVVCVDWGSWMFLVTFLLLCQCIISMPSTGTKNIFMLKLVLMGKICKHNSTLSIFLQEILQGVKKTTCSHKSYRTSLTSMIDFVIFNLHNETANEKSKWYLCWL